MELERNVKNKVGRMRNDEVFQRAKEERLILNILKKYSHSLIGHKTRHNDLNINQLDALNFIMSLFQASTCFEHKCSSSGGQNCAIQSLVSSH